MCTKYLYTQLMHLKNIFTIKNNIMNMMINDHFDQMHNFARNSTFLKFNITN